MASWLDNLSSGLKNIGNSIYNTVYENKDTIGDALSFAGRSLSPEVYGQWKQAQSRQRELLLQGTIKAIEDGSLAPEKGNAVLKKLGVELPDGFAMGPGLPAQKYQAEQAAAIKLEEDLKGAETEAFDATASWYKQKNPTAVVGDKGEVVTTAPERMTRFPEYWENFAASLESRGRRKEAQEALDRAVKLRSAVKPDLEEVAVGKSEKGEPIFRKQYYDRDKMQWVPVGENYTKGALAKVDVHNYPTKPLPEAAQSSLTSARVMYDALQTIKKVKGKAGLVQGWVSRGMAALGQDKDAQDFVTATDNLRVQAQAIIKGIPSNFDVQTIIRTFPDITNPESVNDSRIEFTERTLRTMVKDAIAYFKGAGMIIPQHIVDSAKEMGVELNDVKPWAGSKDPFYETAQAVEQETKKSQKTIKYQDMKK